jgi:hypothetical protein
MIRFLTLLVCAIILKDPYAQNPVNIFALHHDSIPVENIYMQFDKQAYVPGESIWFKAYLWVPGATNTIGSNFYTELLNEKGEVIQSKKMPVVTGKTITGQFDIPQNAPQGIYLVRGWTNYTSFFDQSFIFKKAIPLFNPSNATAKTTAEPGYIFEWFPEGGKLLNGVANVLAFRCMTKQMLPVQMSGNLLNSKGETLGDFSTNRYGVGYFSFPPVKGEMYSAELNFPDKAKQKIGLPTAADNVVVLNVADHEQGKVFTIMTSSADPSAPKDVLLIARINNEIVLKADVELKDNQVQGLVPTANLPEGILRLYVFSKDNHLLAQRACYVTNDNSRLVVELKTNQKNITPKGVNDWSFILPPGLTGSFSVSVTDAEKEITTKNEENIFNSLLFQTGRKEFANVQIRDEEVRDLLMLTGSWFDDDWASFSKMKAPNINDELHVPFKGKLYEQGDNKLITNGKLDVLVKTKDSSGTSYMVPIMKDGSFRVYELVYEDTARIYYRWAGDKNERQINTDIEIEKEWTDFNSLLKNNSFDSWVSGKKQLLDNGDAVALANKLMKEVREGDLFKGKTLQTVVVKTETNKPTGTKEVNKRYATGAFNNLSSSRVVDLVTEPPSQTTGTIFDYIVAKMGGFTIEKAGGRYAIYSSRSTSTQEALRGNSRGLVPGKVYLDEQETTTDNIARIPLEQIALVKYFAPGSITLPGVGLSCVLAVYLRKPEDMGTVNRSYTNSIVFPGYQSNRIFYSPDYNVDDKKRKDNRSTLYWNPDLKPADGSNEIRFNFYNNDSAKRLRVVLEGVTSDGRLVSFDKVVE